MENTTALEVVDPIKRDVTDLPSIFRLAEQIVPTGFLPEHIKTPGQAVAIILAGRELGIGPMLALRSIWMLRGKIELSADLQLSLFKRDGGKSKFIKLNDVEASLELTHPNGDKHTETFTMQDAARAGLTDYNWKKYPKAMLRSRVITAGLKSIGFEPTCGAYGNGEIGGPMLIAPADEPGAEPVPVPMVTDAEPTKDTPKPEPAPAPAKAVQPKPTAATLAWTLKQLVAEPDGANRQMVTDFLVAMKILEPGKLLESWPLEWVPNSPAKLRDLGAAIAEFSQGGQAHMPYSAYVEPVVVNAPWQSYVITWGKLKDTALGQLPTDVLLDLWKSFHPKDTYLDKKTKTEKKKWPEALAADKAMRDALDAAGKEKGFDQPAT